MSRSSAWLLPALLAVALLALLYPTRLLAQVPVDVSVEATPRTATVGDHVTVTISVQHPSDLLITLQPPERTPSVAVLTEDPLAETEPLSAETSVTRFTLTLAAFATGPVTPPPAQVLWLADDGASGEVTAALPALDIEATRAPGDGELRPLKPQLDAAGAPPVWATTRTWAAIGAVSLLALAVVLAFLLVRQLLRRAPTPVAERTPEQAARAELDAVTAEALLERGAFGEFYERIARTVRDYLAARFGFNAAALTTSELTERMTRLGVERWQARLVSGLLERCDAAIYAHSRPDPASADHDLTVAYEIVALGDPALAPERTPETAAEPERTAAR